MCFILLVSSISVVSKFFKHFTKSKVEKITIRWIALASSAGTEGLSMGFSNHPIPQVRCLRRRLG
jgi:hypothetical protein